MISLRGELVSLRALEPDDVDVLYLWENDPRVWSVSDTLTPYSRDTIRRFIENQKNDIYHTKQLRLMICRCVDDVPVGMIDIFDFDPLNLRAAIGILICEEADRRKGYASEALDLVCSYTSEVLRLHQVYCSVHSDNIPSIELFSGKEFVKTGIKSDWSRLGDGWRDEILFQRIFF